MYPGRRGVERAPVGIDLAHIDMRASAAIVFVALTPFGAVWPFVGCFGLATAIGLLAAATSGRAAVAAHSV